MSGSLCGDRARRTKRAHGYCDDTAPIPSHAPDWKKFNKCTSEGWPGVLALRTVLNCVAAGEAESSKLGGPSSFSNEGVLSETIGDESHDEGGIDSSATAKI